MQKRTIYKTRKKTATISPKSTPQSVRGVVVLQRMASVPCLSAGRTHLYAHGTAHLRYCTRALFKAATAYVVVSGLILLGVVLTGRRYESRCCAQSFFGRLLLVLRNTRRDALVRQRTVTGTPELHVGAGRAKLCSSCLNVAHALVHIFFFSLCTLRILRVNSLGCLSRQTPIFAKSNCMFCHGCVMSCS